MNILHITPHLGGGVGTVVTNMLRYFNANSTHNNTLICLDKLRSESKHFLSQDGLLFIENASSDILLLKKYINDSDVVLLHWWNHPLSGKFLYDLQKLGPCRLALWCHISGLTEPNNLIEAAIKISDKFIFTTPLSYGAKSLRGLSSLQRSKLSWIWSTRGIDYFPAIPSDIKEEPLRLLYFGNLDYAKLSFTFPQIIKELGKDAIFIDIAGPPVDKFIDDLKSLNLQSNVVYHGFVTEARKHELLNSASIFIYPLAPNHYGTCDQAIQEAMAYGLVPVVYSNPMEAYMIAHEENGIIASSPYDFIKSTRNLIENKHDLRRLSKSAKIFSHQYYNLSSLRDQWDHVFQSLSNLKKSSKVFIEVDPGSLGYQLFKLTVPSISSQIDLLVDSSSTIDTCIQSSIRNYFSSTSQTSPSKSSINQFLQYFPQDRKLRLLKNQLQTFITCP